MIITCKKCGNPTPVSATREQYLAWTEGKKLIQDAMPDVPKEDREMFLSGICSICWRKMFSEDRILGDA